MDQEYMKKQEKNREEALKHMSEWVDCFLRADIQYKNILANDYMTLLTIKAQGNEELNDKLSHIIRNMDVLKKIFS